MKEDPLFIEDGFTRTHTIAAVSGLHPEVKVTYRPALSKERAAYGAKTTGRDPDAIAKHEDDLVLRYVQTINGQDKESWGSKINRMHPTVKSAIVDLILGYSAANESADLGN